MRAVRMQDKFTGQINMTGKYSLPRIREEAVHMMCPHGVAGVMWKGPENTFIEVGTEQQRHGLRKRSSGEYWSTTKNDSRMCQAGAVTVQRSRDPES